MFAAAHIDAGSENDGGGAGGTAAGRDQIAFAAATNGGGGVVGVYHGREAGTCECADAAAVGAAAVDNDLDVAAAAVSQVAKACKPFRGETLEERGREWWHVQGCALFRNRKQLGLQWGSKTVDTLKSLAQPSSRGTDVLWGKLKTPPVRFRKCVKQRQALLMSFAQPSSSGTDVLWEMSKLKREPGSGDFFTNAKHPSTYET